MSRSSSLIRIVTDSTADLPTSVLEQYEIAVVPALVNMLGKSYRDGVELTRKDFYHKLPSLDPLPTTSAPSPQAFSEVYERLLQEGARQILSLHVSSKLSGLFNAAVQGAKEFGERVRVFDSRHVSLGIGYQALECALLAETGALFEAVLERARQVREKVKMLVFIDTLENLRRSGRVGGLTAGFGKMLKIKLLLEVRAGLLERKDQVRTTAKALDNLFDLTQDWGPLKRLAIGHAIAYNRALEFAERMSKQYDQEPWIFDTTPALGVHAGPGAIGVFGLPE